MIVKSNFDVLNLSFLTRSQDISAAILRDELPGFRIPGRGGVTGGVLLVPLWDLDKLFRTRFLLGVLLALISLTWPLLARLSLLAL